MSEGRREGGREGGRKGGMMLPTVLTVATPTGILEA